MQYCNAQWNLPNHFNNNIDATITMADENIYFFKDNKIVAFGEEKGTVLSASISEWPSNWQGISAALQWDTETGFLFSGTSYLTLDLVNKVITGGDIWPGLPVHWSDQIDAVVDWSPSEVYFFFGSEFIAYDKNTQEYTEPNSLNSWGLPNNWANSIDAALNGGEGNIYFFKGGEYIIYDQNTGLLSEVTNINLGSSVSYGKIPSPGERAASQQSNAQDYANIQESSASKNNNRKSLESTEEEVYEEETEESDDPALAIRPTTPFPDEYRDDYKPYTKALMDITWGAATSSTVRPLAAKNWIGTGVDILYVDPLRVNKSKRAPKTALLMTDSDEFAGNASEYIIPFGTKFESIGQGDTKTSKQLLKTFGEFATTFGGSVGGFVDVPMVASGSASASYKQMNSASFGTEKVYAYKQATNELYKVALSLDWVDNVTHQKYRQKLDKEFRTKVSKLKVPSNMSDITMPSKKGDKLPNSLNNLKTAYKSLITAYGTHLTQAVTYGGRYISLYEINRSTYESARMSKAGFEAAASATIKGVSFGADVSFEYEDKRKQGQSSSSFNATSYVTGGSGTTFEKWEEKITDAPAPIEFELMPLHTLLSKIYFPNDPDIEDKAKILKAVMLEYVCSKMNLPKEVDLDGNNFFKELNPLEYEYEVSIEHLKCTKVSSEEPGSENEFFGNMTFSYGGKKTTVWDKDEDATISLFQDGTIPIRIRDGYKITLAEGKKGVLSIAAHLFEEDTDYGAFGDDDDLGTDSKKVNLHEIGNEPKTVYLEFSHDGDEAEFKININKTLKVTSY